MSPFLFLYTALVGFFAFAAIYHLILWWTSRREPLLAVFSLDCLARSALSAVLVVIATSTTTAGAQAALRVRIALGLVVTVTALWSYSLVSGVRAQWFVWPMTAVMLALLAVHTAVVPLNSAVISLAQLTLPWGERITQPDFATPGWWLGPLYAMVISSHVFGLYCGSRLWARDPVASTLILFATSGTLVILVLDALRSFHAAVVPFVGVVPHVLWVSVIAILIAREHRRTRELLTASQHRFRGIFGQTFQFIGLMRTDGTLIEANRTALDFAGVREEDVIGKPFWETPWWSHSPELQERLRAAILAARAGDTVRFEATHPRHDGRLAHVDFSLKPVSDEHGGVTLLIPEGRDITDRKEAEEHRQVLEAQDIRLSTILDPALACVKADTRALTTRFKITWPIRPVPYPPDPARVRLLGRRGLRRGRRHPSRRGAHGPDRPGRRRRRHAGDGGPPTGGTSHARATSHEGVVPERLPG